MRYLPSHTLFKADWTVHPSNLWLTLLYFQWASLQISLLCLQG